MFAPNEIYKSWLCLKLLRQVHQSKPSLMSAFIYEKTSKHKIIKNYKIFDLKHSKRICYWQNFNKLYRNLKLNIP